MFGLLRNLDSKDKFVLLIGLFTFVKIRLVGVISVSELLLLSMYVFYPSIRFVENKYVKRLFIFAALWCLGSFISNIYNDSTQVNLIKGVIFILLFIAIIPPIFNLFSDKPARLLIFLIGSGVSYYFSPYFNPDEEIAERLMSDVYQYYRYLAFINALGFFLYYKGYHKIGVFLCFGFAFYGLFNMARNPFLISSLAVLLLLVCRTINGSYEDIILQYRSKIPKIFLTIFITLVSVSFIYETLVLNGTLGDEAKKKYIVQSARGGVLEGGRGETFMGIELIRRNPIIGYGSYAKDKTGSFFSEYYREHGFKNGVVRIKDRLLPSHSHIVGAWMQDGILGGLFWLYVLWMCWKIFISGCFMFERRLLCLLMFQFCSLLWNIMFSPFGDRVSTAALIITFLVIYDNQKKGFYQSEIVER